MTAADVELNRLAARQHGAFTRIQALETGLTRSQVHWRVLDGSWIRVAPAVYVVCSSRATWERHLQVAILSHPGSVVAGRSAGVLHKMEGFRPSMPEILAPFPGNGRSKICRVIRSRLFDAVSTKLIAGFTTTTVAETILTLSLREYPSTIERIVDRELAAGSLTVHDFNPIFDRLENARQPGLRSLRRIIASRTSAAYQPPTSELEHHLYELLSHPDLPQHLRQLPIQYEQAEATVDGYIPDWRLIVEADGRRWHTRKADFDRDRRRDNMAAEAGFQVIRFSYQMLTNEPERCLATLVKAGRWRSTA